MFYSVFFCFSLYPYTVEYLKNNLTMSIFCSFLHGVLYCFWYHFSGFSQSTTSAYFCFMFAIYGSSWNDYFAVLQTSRCKLLLKFVDQILNWTSSERTQTMWLVSSISEFAFRLCQLMQYARSQLDGSSEVIDAFLVQQFTSTCLCLSRLCCHSV